VILIFAVDVTNLWAGRMPIEQYNSRFFRRSLFRVLDPENDDAENRRARVSRHCGGGLPSNPIGVARLLAPTLSWCIPLGFKIFICLRVCPVSSDHIAEPIQLQVFPAAFPREQIAPITPRAL